MYLYVQNLARFTDSQHTHTHTIEKNLIPNVKINQVPSPVNFNFSQLIIIFLNYILIFIILKFKKTDRQIFHIHFHSSDVPQSQRWYKLKPGTQNSMQGSHVGGKTQVLSPLSADSGSMHQQECRSEAMQSGCTCT